MPVTEELQASSRAYGRQLDGTEFSLEPPYDRQQLLRARATASEFLIAAGFELDSESNRFFSAPEGAKLSYTMVLMDLEGSAEQQLAETAAELFAEVGIELRLVSEEQWQKNYMGYPEMWCGIMPADQALPLGEPFLYEFNNEDAISSLEVNSSMLRFFAERVMDAAEILPYYRVRTCLYFDPQRVDVSAAEESLVEGGELCLWRIERLYSS